MDKCHVRLLSHALQQIDDIYGYIANELKSETAAESLVEKLEEAIFLLKSCSTVTLSGEREHMQIRATIKCL